MSESATLTEEDITNFQGFILDELPERGGWIKILPEMEEHLPEGVSVRRWTEDVDEDGLRLAWLRRT